MHRSRCRDGERSSSFANSSRRAITKRRVHMPRRQRPLDLKRLILPPISVSPANTRRIASIASAGRCERFASVSFLTFPSSR